MLGQFKKVFDFQLTVVGLHLTVGYHVRVLVEEVPKSEKEPAVILHRLMVVTLAVDQRHNFRIAILNTVQVRKRHNLFFQVRLASEI